MILKRKSEGLEFDVAPKLDGLSKMLDDFGMNPIKVRTRYRNYMSLELVVVISVIMSFKVIPAKEIAAILASSLFLLSTLFILFWETKHAGFQKRATFIGGVVFLVFSVFPVMVLRFFNWGASFDALTMLGWTGSQIHQFANYVFLLFLVCLFIDNFQEVQRLRKLEDEK